MIQFILHYLQNTLLIAWCLAKHPQASYLLTLPLSLDSPSFRFTTHHRTQKYVHRNQPKLPQTQRAGLKKHLMNPGSIPDTHSPAHVPFLPKISPTHSTEKTFYPTNKLHQISPAPTHPPSFSPLSLPNPQTHRPNPPLSGPLFPFLPPEPLRTKGKKRRDSNHVCCKFQPHCAPRGRHDWNIGTVRFHRSSRVRMNKNLYSWVSVERRISYARSTVPRCRGKVSWSYVTGIFQRFVSSTGGREGRGARA